MSIHTLPNLAGLGLRSPHLTEVLNTRPNVAWWEVHSENYFGGGAPIKALEKIRENYPISLHGIGLGLGNPMGLDPLHLKQLAELVQRVTPASVSEHLAWNRFNQTAFTDLLPIPRYKGAIDRVTQHIDQVQERLKRCILIENISTYIVFEQEEASEASFLSELVSRTGCGILLDINNLYVNQYNLGINPYQEIDKLPHHSIGEIHIAGHEIYNGIAIDTHGSPPCSKVWRLLQYVLKRTGPKPVLLERDTNLPPLKKLLSEYQALQTSCSIGQFKYDFI